MVTMCAQFTKLGPFSAFQLFKLSKLCYHFLSSFENENNFFLISVAIPRPLLSGIHWPINLTKKLMFLYIFKKKKKLNWNVEMGPGKNGHLFCCWKYTETSIFLTKILGLWIPYGDGQGIARDIKKKLFSFSKCNKKR